MKKSINLITLVLIVVSCSSVKVVSDVDPSVDWTKYKTFSYYGWAEESNKILNRFDFAQHDMRRDCQQNGIIQNLPIRQLNSILILVIFRKSAIYHNFLKNLLSCDFVLSIRFTVSYVAWHGYWKIPGNLNPGIL